MSTLVTRAGKGSPLTHNEVDANFNNLNSDKSEKASNLSDLTSAPTARTNLGLVIGTDVLSPSGSGASLTSLNATNIASGTLAAARLPALVGDASSSAGSNTLTLATVNSNTGSFGSTTLVPVITVNGKGLITAVSTASISGGSGTVTSVGATVPAFLSVSGSPITSSGTLAFTYSGTALPLANGGTASTSAPQANATLRGWTTTATATGTTTLTNASSHQQEFTGTLGQTVVLPVTSTLALGWSFEIINNSTGSLTIQSSGLNTIGTITAGTTASLVCILITGTTAASWDFDIDGFATETGTGSVVRATSPTLVTPALGTPSSGTLTNCTFPTLNQNTTGSSATVTGNATGSTFGFNSGYGSVATVYGCRSWVNFNGTGTVAIRASGNVSSITDNGTGNYTVNFTTSMPDANYAAIVSNQSENFSFPVKNAALGTVSTSSIGVYIGSGETVLQDHPVICVSIFR
jgi:hypothetical protein